MVVEIQGRRRRRWYASRRAVVSGMGGCCLLLAGEGVETGDYGSLAMQREAKAGGRNHEPSTAWGGKQSWRSGGGWEGGRLELGNGIRV